MQTINPQLASPIIAPNQLKMVTRNLWTPQNGNESKQYPIQQVMHIPQIAQIQQIQTLQPVAFVAHQKPSVTKRITSSMDDKKEKVCVKDSVDKKKRSMKAIAKPQKESKKAKEIEAKKPAQRVRSMPLTQQALSEINKIHYIQKMNRVREWLSQDQEDCLYPLFY